MESTRPPPSPPEGSVYSIGDTKFSSDATFFLDNIDASGEINRLQQCHSQEALAAMNGYLSKPNGGNYKAEESECNKNREEQALPLAGEKFPSTNNAKSRYAQMDCDSPSKKHKDHSKWQASWGALEMDLVEIGVHEPLSKICGNVVDANEYKGETHGKPFLPMHKFPVLLKMAHDKLNFENKNQAFKWLTDRFACKATIFEYAEVESAAKKKEKKKNTNSKEDAASNSNTDEDAVGHVRGRGQDLTLPDIGTTALARMTETPVNSRSSEQLVASGWSQAQFNGNGNGSNRTLFQVQKMTMNQGISGDQLGAILEQSNQHSMEQLRMVLQAVMPQQQQQQPPPPPQGHEEIMGQLQALGKEVEGLREGQAGIQARIDEGNTKIDEVQRTVQKAATPASVADHRAEAAPGLRNHLFASASAATSATISNSTPLRNDASFDSKGASVAPASTKASATPRVFTVDEESESEGSPIVTASNPSSDWESPPANQDKKIGFFPSSAENTDIGDATVHAGSPCNGSRLANGSSPSPVDDADEATVPAAASTEFVDQAKNVIEILDSDSENENELYVDVDKIVNPYLAHVIADLAIAVSSNGLELRLPVCLNRVVRPYKKYDEIKKRLEEIQADPGNPALTRGNKISSLYGLAQENIRDQETSIICTSCPKPVTIGIHKCINCNKDVHIPCSVAAPGAEDEEGYGQKRVCKSCLKKSTSSPKKPSPVKAVTSAVKSVGKAFVAGGKRLARSMSSKKDVRGHKIPITNENRPCTQCRRLMEKAAEEGKVSKWEGYCRKEHLEQAKAQPGFKSFVEELVDEVQV